MRYNERVQEFNTLRRRFPSNVTAKVFGFKEYPYFEAPAAAQQLPKVISARSDPVDLELRDDGDQGRAAAGIRP